MANVLSFFMSPEDEVAFFRSLERFHLEVYPERVPQDWQAFRADATSVPKLPEEALYLAASELAPVLVDKVKRGKDKGAWRVDEVRSPVIHFTRSRPNEAGELVSGRMWAELDVTQQTGRRDPAPDRFRQLYLDVEGWLKKTFRRGDPKEFFIGPTAARMFKEGLVLREAGLRGGTVRPHR
ncbi:MAG: hypothetical protein ACYC8T_05315 [Myxococcaceae bacterium]